MVFSFIQIFLLDCISNNFIKQNKPFFNKMSLFNVSGFRYWDTTDVGEALCEDFKKVSLLDFKLLFFF